LPGCGSFLAQKLSDGSRVKLFLAAKVPIEAAMRKAGIAHDLLDGDPGITIAVEKAPGAFEDFFASSRPR
jgi:hypothetical protein